MSLKAWNVSHFISRCSRCVRTHRHARTRGGNLLSKLAPGPRGSLEMRAPGGGRAGDTGGRHLPPPRSAFQPLPRQRWGSGMQQGAEALVVPRSPTRQCPSYTGHAAGATVGAGDALATAGPPRSRTRPGALRAGRSAGIALHDRAASISQ